MYLGVGKAYFFRFWRIYFEEFDSKIELRSICFFGIGFDFFVILGNLSVLIIPPYLLRSISCIFSLNSPKLFSLPQHSDSLSTSKKFICLFFGSSSNISKLLLILLQLYKCSHEDSSSLNSSIVLCPDF